jgi:hypothetical protein
MSHFLESSGSTDLQAPINTGCGISQLTENALQCIVPFNGFYKVISPTEIVKQSLVNPSAWSFEFRCRVSPAVIFSDRHLNSDRELIYSSLFLNYMRYKYE